MLTRESETAPGQQNPSGPKIEELLLFSNVILKCDFYGRFLLENQVKSSSVLERISELSGPPPLPKHKVESEFSGSLICAKLGNFFPVPSAFFSTLCLGCGAAGGRGVLGNSFQDRRFFNTVSGSARDPQ